MDREVRFDSNGNDITCMKVFDALVNPCDACDISNCPDRIVHATQAATTEEKAWRRLGLIKEKGYV